MGDRLVVNQPPGEGDALGRLLFMFPNEHSVYLHDTPMRALFGAARRAYSHGCVRVDEPLRLAELLMGGAARGWSARKIPVLAGNQREGGFLAAAAADPHRIFHRIRRCERRPARARGRLWADGSGRCNTFALASRLKQ